MKTIVIDPGHGMPDPGAVGPTGLTEEAVVLNVCLRLEEFLLQEGLEVVLTRRDHITAGSIPLGFASNRQIKSHSLRSRVAIAQAHHADLFVSVHANAALSPAAHGFEIFYNEEGWAAACTMYGVMEERLKSHRARRCESALFYVLKHNPCPAILVELEFISNPEQEAIFRKENSLNFYAETLAQGINDFIDIS